MDISKLIYHVIVETSTSSTLEGLAYVQAVSIIWLCTLSDITPCTLCKVEHRKPDLAYKCTEQAQECLSLALHLEYVQY